MDERERRENEQNIYRRIHKARIIIRNVVLNVIVVVSCVAASVNIFHYLMIESRNQKENEELVLNVIVLVCFLLLGVLSNFWLDKLFDKFLSAIKSISDNKNKKAITKIKNLDVAVHQLSKSNGVVIWDTLWGVFACFILATLLVPSHNSNETVVLGLLSFILVMLLGGHLIIKNIYKHRRFDNLVYKYTQKYIDILDKNTYIDSIDKSIQRGVLGYAGLWMMTDEYIIGRSSDIAFEPVAIPRSEVMKYIFFLEKKINVNSLPVGVLQCKLNNGKYVNYAIGRGKVCEQTLQILKEQGIFWTQEEMQYI